MLTLKVTALLAMLSSLDGVMAGAGANVFACVNYPSTPASHNVTFDPDDSQNQCMNDIGSVQTIRVNSSGLSCADLGYVESKKSGAFCLSAASLWGLSFKTEGLSSEKSGSLSSRWYARPVRRNLVELRSYSEGTAICGSRAMCSSTEYRWSSGSVGRAYVIFQPTKII